MLFDLRRRSSESQKEGKLSTRLKHKLDIWPTCIKNVGFINGFDVRDARHLIMKINVIEMFRTSNTNLSNNNKVSNNGDKGEERLAMQKLK